MMKRVLFITMMFFLAACSADSIPQEGLSNAVVFNEGVAAVFLDQEPLMIDKVEIQCAGVFEPGETEARVIFRVTAEDDSQGIKWPLYGGASIVGTWQDGGYDVPQSFTCEGSGQMRAYQTNPEGMAALVDWLLEQHYDSVTAQIDGVMTPLSDVTIVGWANAGGAETAVLTQNENITELKAFQCQGTMIPNSSQAAVTFTAETANGQTFAGGGILETSELIQMGADPNEFQCSMQDEGWVSAVFEPNAEGYYLGQALMNLSFPTLQVRTSSGKQHIMFETFMTATVLGGVVFEVETTD